MEGRRVLLTGMSGVGKSTIVGELRQRGFCAVDMDEAGWSQRDGAGHQRWNLDRLRAAMDAAGAAPLLVAGCAEDQAAVAFTHRILLSAPWAVMARRIDTRSGNPYGKCPAELREIRTNLERFEPLLRRAADREIVTDQPLEAVVAAVLAVLDPDHGAAG